MSGRRSCVLILAVVAGMANLSSLSAETIPTTPGSPPELPHRTRGYLDLTGLPDSMALLPPPPGPGSPAFARDEAVRESAAALRGTERWTQAVTDADLRFPHAAATFSCATNLPISEQRTPRLYALLGRSLIDIALSTHRAKAHYKRVRPFAMHDGQSCTPANDDAMRKDGSYPSGHGAAGWGWALILVELFPDRTDAILARGRDFGESRVVCNVHWQSDVEAGRVMASAAVARLHAVPSFKADLEAAREEIDLARAEGARPDGEACATEANALRKEP